jgi:hypothetical protein
LVYLFGECGEVNDYLDQLDSDIEKLNGRIAIVENQASLSEDSLQNAIEESRHDVESLMMEEVPEKVDDLHQQRIALYIGWVEVFEAFRDGTIQRQMLIALQAEDDEFERLYTAAALECS